MNLELKKNLANVTRRNYLILLHGLHKRNKAKSAFGSFALIRVILRKENLGQIP
jgi:hypothetical protein